jgi:hypothetical protein
MEIVRTLLADDQAEIPHPRVIHEELDYLL